MCEVTDLQKAQSTAASFLTSYGIWIIVIPYKENWNWDIYITEYNKVPDPVISLLLHRFMQSGSQYFPNPLDAYNGAIRSINKAVNNVKQLQEL